MSDKWKRYEEKYWISETKQMFPFEFWINTSLAGHGANAEVRLQRWSYDEKDKEKVKEVKVYFDKFIKDSIEAKNRLMELEARVKELERNMLPPPIDFVI